MSERLRLAQLCKSIGLAIDLIKQLFIGAAVTITAKLHSLEHDQSFSVQDAKLKVYKESKGSDRLKLTINEQNILDWFKQKSQELKRATTYYKRPSIKSEEGKSKGFRGNSLRVQLFISKFVI